MINKEFVSAGYIPVTSLVEVLSDAIETYGFDSIMQSYVRFTVDDEGMSIDWKLARYE